jgi:hypothetical protein
METNFNAGSWFRSCSSRGAAPPHTLDTKGCRGAPSGSSADCNPDPGCNPNPGCNPDPGCQPDGVDDPAAASNPDGAANSSGVDNSSVSDNCGCIFNKDAFGKLGLGACRTTSALVSKLESAWRCFLAPKFDAWDPSWLELPSSRGSSARVKLSKTFLKTDVFAAPGAFESNALELSPGARAAACGSKAGGPGERITTPLMQVRGHTSRSHLSER